MFMTRAVQEFFRKCQGIASRGDFARLHDVSGNSRSGFSDIPNELGPAFVERSDSFDEEFGLAERTL
jgi:hypothetical protein